MVTDLDLEAEKLLWPRLAAAVAAVMEGREAAPAGRGGGGDSSSCVHSSPPHNGETKS